MKRFLIAALALCLGCSGAAVAQVSYSRGGGVSAADQEKLDALYSDGAGGLALASGKEFKASKITSPDGSDLFFYAALNRKLHMSQDGLGGANSIIRIQENNTVDILSNAAVLNIQTPTVSSTYGDLIEIAAPGAPGSDRGRWYLSTDGNLYFRFDSGAAVLVATHP